MDKSCAFASPGHNCSQPLEHCNRKQLMKETHSVSETSLAELIKQFLSELYGHSRRRYSRRHSRRYERQPSTSDLSNQVSDEKSQFQLRGRNSSFPAAPQASTDRRGFQLTTEQNGLPGDTRRAKAKKSLCVLKEYVSKSSCPVGLQYRPRPHLRPDQNFNTDL